MCRLGSNSRANAGTKAKPRCSSLYVHRAHVRESLKSTGLAVSCYFTTINSTRLKYVWCYFTTATLLLLPATLLLSTRWGLNMFESLSWAGIGCDFLVRWEGIWGRSREWIRKVACAEMQISRDICWLRYPESQPTEGRALSGFLSGNAYVCVNV